MRADDRESDMVAGLLLPRSHTVRRALWRIAACALVTNAAALSPILVFGAVADQSLTVADCGDVFTNAFGPFDYNNANDRENLPIVERVHFTPIVESLERGNTSTVAMDDISYTLRAFPNHHRALNAVARQELDKGGIPPNYYSAQCWFDRAIRFRPDDGNVWLVYANFLTRKNRQEDALEAYGRAKKLLPESPEVDYNLGLLYFKMGRYEQSLSHAKMAYAGNYPLQGLRRKLKERGYDVDHAAPARP